MDRSKIVQLAIAGAGLWAAYKYIKSPAVRAMVLGVSGVLIVKNTPVINQYIPV